MNMTYSDMKRIFQAWERSKEAKDYKLVGEVTFTAENWPDSIYSEESRTCEVSSNNKAYMPNMCEYSIYGRALDGSNNEVRLDWYIADEIGKKNGWEVEKCEIIGIWKR